MLREQLALLIELQQVELALRSIDEKKKELPEKLSILAADFKKAETHVADQRKRHEELVKRHREKEDRLKRDGEALKKTKERLYDVKTNKEYQAILKEIEMAEAKYGEFESEIIVLFDELDAIKAALQVEEAKLKDHMRSYENEKTKLEGELTKLDALIGGRQRQNDDLRRRIAADLLKKYDLIKQANAGLAVTSVWKAVCRGCHMNVPPQLYNELQRSVELNYCPNCHRIIYWYDQNKENE